MCVSSLLNNFKENFYCLQMFYVMNLASSKILIRFFLTKCLIIYLSYVFYALKENEQFRSRTWGLTYYINRHHVCVFVICNRQWSSCQLILVDCGTNFGIHCWYISYCDVAAEYITYYWILTVLRFLKSNWNVISLWNMWAMFFNFNIKRPKGHQCPLRTRK